MVVRLHLACPQSLFSPPDKQGCIPIYFGADMSVYMNFMEKMLELAPETINVYNAQLLRLATQKRDWTQCFLIIHGYPACAKIMWRGAGTRDQKESDGKS